MRFIYHQYAPPPLVNDDFISLSAQSTLFHLRLKKKFAKWLKSHGDHSMSIQLKLPLEYSHLIYHITFSSRRDMSHKASNHHERPPTKKKILNMHRPFAPPRCCIHMPSLSQLLNPSISPMFPLQYLLSLDINTIIIIFDSINKKKMNHAQFIAKHEPEKYRFAIYPPAQQVPQAPFAHSSFTDASVQLSRPRRLTPPATPAPAILEYTLKPPHGINFHHTFVPPEFRGTGVGKILVDAGLNYAKVNNLTVEATCSYVAKFLVEKAKL